MDPEDNVRAMAATGMLVLDTNVPRDLVDGDVSPDAFESFAREGGTVHIADGAIVELLAWLDRAPNAWPKWKERRAVFDRFLDRDRPILMGGGECLAEAGLICEAPPPLLLPAVHKALNLHLWAAMRNAQDFDELRAATPLQQGRRLLTVHASGAGNQVRREHGEWRERFAELKAAAEAERFSPSDDELPAQLEGYVAALGKFIDSKCASAPRASIRMDGMMRVDALLTLRSVKKTEPYNAGKHDHDTFDLDLLRYLALPAAVCTADRGVHNHLAAAGAWQGAFVVTPDRLALPEVRARLRAYDWRSGPP